MRKSLVGLWFALQICSLWSLDTANAQVGSVVGTVTDNNVTANLITSPLSPTVAANAPMGFSGGSSVGYNATTNTYYFGYNQQTIAKTIAINNALQGSGIQVTGVQYGMSYLNGGDTYGTLAMNVAVTNSAGAAVQSYNHSFNTQNAAWQQFNQTQTFTNPYLATNLGNVSMSITGKDSRWWAGYYGPQVKDPYLKLTYGADPKTYYNIPDDGYVPVNLPFTFPFYGRNFTSSYMFSNGVVGFLDPTTHGNSFCCDGVDLSSNPGSPWHFAIYALQTDLIQANANAKFYTQGNSTYMKYAWENINEYGTNNLNTFSATIKPTGFIGIDHTAINVQNHNVTTGIAGDLSIGQYSQYYNGPGNIFPIPGSTLTFTGTEVADLCLTNPLSSPTCPNYTAAMCQTNPLYSQACPGYAQAYYDQQCSLNQLYDTNCPGYAQAYLNYQCSQNPLYSTTCSGYDQAYFDQQCSANPLYNSRCPGYDAAYLSQQCSNNPLYSTSCTGYARAYHDQQCSTNPLYATDCSGYQQAYLNQQCGINPLYSNQCSGYAQAYHDQQCSLNPLYATDCSGYANAYKAQQCSLNQLYATDCPGYATAYFNQQCSLDPLYNSRCAGYEQAYFNQQCSLNPLYNSNCTGYTQAYHDQQCSLNALYATDCSGYQAAYKTQQCTLSALYATDCPGYAAAYKAQQCSINALYATDCPGYAAAYFTQQCSLNPLYDKTCAGYDKAYALKYIVPTTTVVATTTTTTTAETTSVTPATTNDGSSSVAVAVVADPVVNQAVTSTATSASPAQAATATVPLVTTPTVEMKVEVKAEAKQEEKKTDASSTSVSSTTTAQGTSTETKPAAPTARQELAAKREAAAKAAAVEKGKNLANEMGKVADMESQKQVQNVVIQAMGFTPGFDAYGKVMVPDAIGYRPFTVYNNQKNVDNRRLGMGLYGPSDRLHNELVGSQYGE